MRAKVLRRLESYWRMEAGNVILVPAVTALVVWRLDDSLSWPLALAMGATAFLLIIGAIAWRMEVRTLHGRPEFEARMLPWLAQAQPVSLLLVLASVAGAALEWRHDGGWTPSALATGILAGLAVLEYVNYYHVQLQHFDNAADLKRLLAGRGFRKAHLARALQRRRRLHV